MALALSLLAGFRTASAQDFVISDESPAIRACIVGHVLAVPGSERQLAVALLVEEDGSISRVAIDGAEQPTSRFLECLFDAYRQSTRTEPPGPVELVLTYSVPVVEESPASSWEASVERAIDGHQGGLQACYDAVEELMVGGEELVAWLDINADGGVRRARFVEQSVWNPWLEDCLEDELEALHFEPNPSGHRITVDYPLRFRPPQRVRAGADVVRTCVWHRASSRQPALPPGVTRRDVERAFESSRSAWESCFERASDRFPERVLVQTHLTAGADAETAVAAVNATVSDEGFASCLASALARVRLPRADRAAEYEVLEIFDYLESRADVQIHETSRPGELWWQWEGMPACPD